MSVDADGGTNRQRDEIVSSYLREHGRIICISDDAVMTETLRETVCGHLRASQDCLHMSSEASMLLQFVRDTVFAKKTALLLIEEKIKNRDMSYLLRQIKNGFPELLLILITADLNQQRFSLLREYGIDNCIIKPISVPALIEKMAFVISPPGNLSRLVQNARALLTDNQGLRALEVCREALELKPDSVAVFLTMGDIFKSLGDYPQAVKAYKDAGKCSPGYVEPLQKIVELYRETGDEPAELECLERLDSISPLNVERKLRIGEICIRQERAEQAQKVFDEVMSISGREAVEHVAGMAFHVADMYSASSPQAAAIFLQRGLEAKKEYLGVEDIASFNMLGILLRRAGKWREAAAEYQKAIKIQPDDDKLHYNLAMACLEGEDFAAARTAVVKALSLNKNLPRKSATVATNIALVFARSGDRMHAIPLLKVALEREPGNAQASKLLRSLFPDGM